MHEITEGLERLPTQIAYDQHVDFFVMGRHKDVSRGSVSGLGVIIERSDGGKAKPIAAASDTTESTHYRALLTGVLSSLEWAAINCNQGTLKCIHSSEEAIYLHLPKGIKKWVTEPERQNRKLLAKIDALLDSILNVNFKRLRVDDPRYLEAKKLAEGAADRRASQSVTSNEAWKLEPEHPEFDADTEMLRRNALAKDP
jgi:hypothetical protein